MKLHLRISDIPLLENGLRLLLATTKEAAETTGDLIDELKQQLVDQQMSGITGKQEDHFINEIEAALKRRDDYLMQCGQIEALYDHLCSIK